MNLLDIQKHEGNNRGGACTLMLALACDVDYTHDRRAAHVLHRQSTDPFITVNLYSDRLKPEFNASHGDHGRSYTHSLTFQIAKIRSDVLQEIEKYKNRKVVAVFRTRNGQYFALGSPSEPARLTEKGDFGRMNADFNHIEFTLTAQSRFVIPTYEYQEVNKIQLKGVGVSSSGLQKNETRYSNDEQKFFVKVPPFARIKRITVYD